MFEPENMDYSSKKDVNGRLYIVDRMIHFFFDLRQKSGTPQHTQTQRKGKRKKKRVHRMSIAPQLSKRAIGVKEKKRK